MQFVCIYSAVSNVYCIEFNVKLFIEKRARSNLDDRKSMKNSNFA